MINNIFEFDDIVASEVMTHRTDMVAVDINDSTLDDVVRLAIEEGCSRIPAYDGDIDGAVKYSMGVTILSAVSISALYAILCLFI